MTPALVTLQNPRSTAADAYRSLRSNLIFGNIDTPIRTMGITTPAEENQKTTVAANLAVTFAQGEYRTLLIDADLRRPSIHTLWGIENKQGLTAMLLDENLLEHPPVHQSEVAELAILNSGESPANPVDILASSKMAKAVEILSEQFDILIFLLPPVLVGADAMVLGQRLDGVLMVTQANHTRRDQTTRAKEQLERVHINLLGAVLLDAPNNRASDQYR